LFEETCALNCSLNKEIDESETLCNRCNNCNNLNDCTSSPNVSNILNFKCTETVDRNFNLFGSKKGLHIGCLNIQHILPKLDEVKFVFAHAFPSPDIFGFCETFLSDKVSDSELNLSNFYLERKDRQSGQGGGIIAYISDKIPYMYVRRTDLENDTLEFIWLQINFANTKPF